ncbi:MAG: primosomal protein N' [Chloroflexia bacterium]|nr:primosomal protein N' [Chloroflexia bacterium]
MHDSSASASNSNQHAGHPRTCADVAVSRSLPGGKGGIYTYEVPIELASEIERGLVVIVPLQKRHLPGVVVAVSDRELGFDTRPIHSIPVPRIVLAPERLESAEWLARESASSVYAAAALFLPSGLHTSLIDVYSLPDSTDAPEVDLTPSQRKVIELLRRERSLTIDQLRKATGQSLTSVMGNLRQRGLVRLEIRVDRHVPGPRIERFIRLLDDDAEKTSRSPRQQVVLEHLVETARYRRSEGSDLVALADLRAAVEVDAASLAAMEKKGLVEIVDLPRSEAPQPRPAPAPVLTPEQAAAWAILERALIAGDSKPHLLFGVTGSGKTEIYLRGVAWCLRHGRSAIVLVPEIGLATQVVRRFVDRFPGQVVVLHSQLTASQRYEIWQGIEAGEHKVVVGPRSALFAPVQRLGLIVLDEEHENTYKQDNEPRYHARRFAEYLAAQAAAALVLGSATPSVESVWHADRGDYRRVMLTERVNPSGTRQTAGSLELPEVEIVDLKLELQSGNTSLLSRSLTSVVNRSLQRGEQAIILLNRRGTSTVVLCRACGHRVTCPLCDIPLVYHHDRQQMMCHRCDHREGPPRQCPDCGGRLDYFGAGTQRVEDEVRRTFPSARVLRWDQDSVRLQGGYAAMLARVERHEVDIVVGTQMVAKGFDLPKVTAIGVIQADTILHLPDFRSGERTFQLLTQVAGRAGRRAAGSRVVVQTYTPDHYAIQAAARHDYAAFYLEEIDFREKHLFPPFVRLARYLYRHENERSAAIESEMMAREIVRQARALDLRLDLLGPTPAFAAKLRGKFQWQIVLRSTDLEAMLDDLPVRPGWIVDIDPQSML